MKYEVSSDSIPPVPEVLTWDQVRRAHCGLFREHLDTRGEQWWWYPILGGSVYKIDLNGRICPVIQDPDLKLTKATESVTLTISN